MSQHILDTGTFNPSSDGRPSNPLYLSQKIGEAIRSGGAPGKEYTAPRANSTTRGVTFETMTDARCTSAWHTMRMAFDGRAIITLRWDQGIIGSLVQRGPTTGRLAVAARGGGSVSSILAIPKSDGVPTEVAVPLAITYQTLLRAPAV